MLPIRLSIPKRLLRQFRKAAVAAFPRETCCFLIGTDVTGATSRDIVVHELWTPADVEKHTTPNNTAFQDPWFIEVEEHAREAGLVVVATSHSHPYRHDEISDWKRRPDCSQSEADVDYFSKFPGITGIATITEPKPGKLRVRFRWWGPTTPVVMV